MNEYLKVVVLKLWTCRVSNEKSEITDDILEILPVTVKGKIFVSDKHSPFKKNV